MRDGAGSTPRGSVVTAEFRGEVCVIRCEGARCGLSAGLRERLLECCAAGVRQVVLDVDSALPLGGDEVVALKEATAEFRRTGGEIVLAVEDPQTRVMLAQAGLVRPPLPRPAAAEADRGVALPAAAHWEHEFLLAATAAGLPAARRRVTAFAEVSGLVGSRLFEFSVAVAEALTNAFVHGSPHGADDDIRVRFYCYDDEVAVEVVDGGGGLDATPICVPEASASSGRGIHFMRALCDDVQFICGPCGTHVLLVKRRE